MSRPAILLHEMQMDNYFRKTLKEELDRYLAQEHCKLSMENTLKIDLHCHDYNSDVPDELIGRLLSVPETWLESNRLLQELKRNGCDAFTITNHNNARSCYELQDKGEDILTAAEFSCWVPDYETGIHVLTYGFTPQQEVRLNKLRRNLYAFLDYTCQHDIPTIWAHPLYHYSGTQMLPLSFFHKMTLLFERFETLNGQRDTWQNMLVKEWIEGTTEEDIDRYARKFGISPTSYCRHPYRKILTGGSDSHMGIFAGSTGSYLYVPGLKHQLETRSKSELALEAIRLGQITPYGTHQNTEKLTVAFLNYVCQIAMNYKDPGLIRLALHQGELPQKVTALLASNLFNELQHHKVTMSFVKMFYECMMGKKPAFYKKLLISSDYKPIFDMAAHVAEEYHSADEDFSTRYYHAILDMNKYLNHILAGRIDKKLAVYDAPSLNAETLENFISKLELPVYIRSYVDKEKPKDPINISSFLDGLSFPFFSTLLILMAHFTSAKAMFNTRPFLKRFSRQIGKFQPPERILWLTDTFDDKNGVSMFLQQMHKQIKERNLPIDIMVCSDKVAPDDHLIVLKPLKSFSLLSYTEQSFAIPDFVEVHNQFQQGGYDRVICSTEGVMGLCALYLKHAYTVEATFYLHTDWLMFARKVLGISGRNLDRVRRMLRFFYKSFDKVLVLNSDQQKWLTGKHMALPAEKVDKTSHWVNPAFTPCPIPKKEAFGVEENLPVLLYAGRISNEKGVMEFPGIYAQIKETYGPVQFVIVGKGPALPQLKTELPEAVYIEWVAQEKLAHLYSSADILLLPSRFDTFCNVVLEALSCGLPVIAYNTKGPKDIIIDGECGFLVNEKKEMAEKAIDYLQSSHPHAFRQAAIKRAQAYDAETIITHLLASVGMNHDNE